MSEEYNALREDLEKLYKKHNVTSMIVNLRIGQEKEAMAHVGGSALWLMECIEQLGNQVTELAKERINDLESEIEKGKG